MCDDENETVAQWIVSQTIAAIVGTALALAFVGYCLGWRFQ